MCTNFEAVAAFCEFKGSGWVYHDNLYIIRIPWNGVFRAMNTYAAYL